MAGFEGFADAQGKFFRSLAKHNDRDWFQSHKSEYEEGWNAPMKLLLSEVRAGIDRAYARIDLDEPKVFRIFRDVRFSKDKSPYKTHIGGYIPLARRVIGSEPQTGYVAWPALPAYSFNRSTHLQTAAW